MVVERTEGWAAAVVLAGRLLDRGVPETHDVFRDDGRPVVARLMEQAFGSCPPELREVLLSVCHEDEVGDEEAGALSGDPRAGRLLARVAEQGLLVTAYGDGAGAEAAEPTRWRLHPLLRDFLQRAERGVGADAGRMRLPPTHAPPVTTPPPVSRPGPSATPPVPRTPSCSASCWSRSASTSSCWGSRPSSIPRWPAWT